MNDKIGIPKTPNTQNIRNKFSSPFISFFNIASKNPSYRVDYNASFTLVMQVDSASFTILKAANDAFVRFNPEFPVY